MKKTKRFENKIAIVTGASSGIGRASALALAEEGALVILVARTRSKLEEVDRLISQKGGQALVIPTDVKSTEQVIRMVNQVKKSFGRVDLLFNNAGASHVGKFEHHLFEKNLKELIELDLMGTISITREVLKIMRSQGSGHIMNMSSVVGRKSFPHFGAYSTVMHAISGFTDGLRQELKETGIKVSVIYPALTQTALLDHTDPESMPPPFRAFTPIPVKKVADAVLDGFWKNKRRIVVPFQPKLLLLLDAMSPRFGDTFVNLMSHKWFTTLFGIYKGKTYHQVATGS